MLVIQQNCGKRYKCTISALETALSLEASIIFIQESFVRNRRISHSGFNLYWPSGFEDRKDIRVFTAVRKDIVNKVIFENRSDLISHPYCIVLDVKELHEKHQRYCEEPELSTCMTILLVEGTRGKDQPHLYDEPYKTFVEIWLYAVECYSWEI